MKYWNPQADEFSVSIFIGLVCINESASKECGTITPDLLLRAGILVKYNIETWRLANDWEERRIYLYGDGKTIEKII